MVGFLGRGLQQRTPHLGVFRHRRLPQVKCLGADLARMIDPHQAGCVAALARREHRLAERCGWRSSPRCGRRAVREGNTLLRSFQQMIESG